MNGDSGGEGMDVGPDVTESLDLVSLPDDNLALDVRAEDVTERETVRAEVLDDVHDFFADGAEHDGLEAPAESFIEERFFQFDYLEGKQEIERKWVNEPYAYVSLLYDPERKRYTYHVAEPTLSEVEEYVREDMVGVLRNSLMYEDLAGEGEREEIFTRKAVEAVTEHAATVNAGSVHKVLYYLIRDFVDFGKIDPIMRDGDIEDVSCDGADVPVFVYHRRYRDLRTNVAFDSRTLNSFTVRLAQRAGKHISVSNPLVDASLPDGSRVQLTLGSDVASRGSNFTIRKFTEVPFTPVDMVKFNTFSVEEMAYFWLAIENNRSLVFAGGTGSGKTTSLNAASFFIPPDSKVVSIEDTREITLPHDNWIQGVTRAGVTSGGRGEVSTYQLLQASLRQRPEYILVGEIRTEQRVALTFFQAIGTGHTAYTTVHADSVSAALSRLQNPPLSVPTQMLAELDVLCVQKQIQLDDRRVRRNIQIEEIIGASGENAERLETRTVFKYDPREDEAVKVNDSHALARVAELRGWDDDRLRAELDAREEVLSYLVEHDTTGYDEVAATIHTFARDPDYVLDAVREGTFDPADLPEGRDV